MALFAGFGAIATLLTALVGGISRTEFLGVLSSTALIEYGAAAVAIGMGIPPFPATAFVSLSGLTLIFLIFTVLDILTERSTVVQRLVERAQRRTKTIAWLQRYGAIALVPGVIVVGFWVCVPIAWFLGWRRSHSIVALFLGFLGATIATTAIASGLLGLS